MSAVQTASVASVLGQTQFSYLALAPDITNFPNFFRIIPPTSAQAFAIKETILYYSSIQNGWTDVAVISTADGFGISVAADFIDIAEPELNVKTYRQYIVAVPGEPPITSDLSSELKEIKKSGARVIIPFIFDEWTRFIMSADDTGLVGEEYVWFVPANIVATAILPEARELSRGVVGLVQNFPVTPELVAFRERWSLLDPTEYPGGGPDTPPSPFVASAYDMIIATAIAMQKLDDEGLLGDRVAREDWTEKLGETDFHGLSGRVRFDSNGDLNAILNVQYYDPVKNSWEHSGSWSGSAGYHHDIDVVWYSNNTDVPDLDIREPFRYYSCKDHKFKNDKTGKEISRQTPDGSDIDEIDSDYYCDRFIDCKNMSDESFGCESNFVVLFIVFGVITGILILVALLLIVFVVAFGICLRYKRLRVVSPFFLILILLSVIVGYFSVFAWFGKPHPVACAFQPWLLGLPALSMIAALSVKTFRLWRIFRIPLQKTKITNFELFVLWTLVMIPAVFIVAIWTIISTPTAGIEERDGNDHYVCATGGFTGEPGGIIFFSIFASYGALILLLGGILSFMARHVPSLFNECKLLAISIYNLALLSVVIIPVYLIVVIYNPFIAWILRTCAILYAFTATMCLQFLPHLIGVFLLDKCKNPEVNLSTSPKSSQKSNTFSIDN